MLFLRAQRLVFSGRTERREHKKARGRKSALRPEALTAASRVGSQYIVAGGLIDGRREDGIAQHCT